ncbi:type II toxin-antitoxin system RelE/ParE family toxin [Aquimarina aggregata]|uniref:type II toxin-antitoxin system RelE/ParE family toxin n=1 Tax=Aquimarina aggregata TaxID=1642818 RepID=UPI00248FC388|nr:type II toxin-antitoxin system RelE/ParE family toxin [Aquimarina aggregata]
MAKKYVLSPYADNDIEDIFDYGLLQFGYSQAVNYVEGFEEFFNMLANNPTIGKNRDEIKKGLVSFPYGSHIIFYRAFDTHIRIVRVLYGGRDLLKFLK